MKFQCDRCNTRYSIGDEKVRGKVLKIRCKTCQAVITLRENAGAITEGGLPGRVAASETLTPMTQPTGMPLSALPAAAKAPALEAAFGRAMEARKPEPAPGTGSPRLPAGNGHGNGHGAAAKAAARRPANPSPFDDEATRLSEPAPQIKATEWFVSIDGEQEGPFTLAEAQRRVARRKPDEEMHCWQDGYDDWLPVEDVPELARSLPRPPPPVPVRPGAVAPPGPAGAARSLASVPAAGNLASVSPSTGQPLSAKAQEPRVPSEGDNFDFDIGEASRVVKLPMLMPPGGAMGNAPAMGGLPGTAPRDAGGSGGLPGMQNATTTGNMRRTQAIVVPVSMAAAVASATALAEQGALPNQVAAPKKKATALILAVAGAALLGVGIVAVFAMNRGSDGPKIDPNASLGSAQIKKLEDNTYKQLADFEISPIEREKARIAAENEKQRLIAEAATKHPKPGGRKPGSKTGPIASTNPRTNPAHQSDSLELGDPVQTFRERGIEEVAAAKTRFGGLLQQCYMNAAKSNPDLVGKSSRFDVTITILKSGAVRNVSVSSGGDSGLAACLKARVSTWSFKQASNDLTTQFAMVFK
jgi:predicted Zn finger-like uncharacterized protein